MRVRRTVLRQLIALGSRRLPPRVVEGRTMDPRLHWLEIQARRRAAGTPTVEELRSRFRALVELLQAELEPGVMVEELDLAGRRARVYRHRHARSTVPAVLYFHQGGGVIGELDTADSFCSILAAATRGEVISLDYRLAPEHPFPVAVEDCVAAYRWATERSAAGVAVGGDSMGGYYAAALCREARDRGLPPPVLQLLIYPGTGVRTDWRSVETFADAFPLSREALERFISILVPPGATLEPGTADLSRGDLRGLPPARVYLAGFDVLHDQGRHHAEALEAAGVPVALRSFDELTHAFTAFTGLVPAARRACQRIADEVAADLQRVELDATEAELEHDVVVVGAGLSGISIARELSVHRPSLSFTVLEARQALGGTWDLFRYPGIRSDSDMYTFGFSFKPWKDPRPLADGPSIRAYLEETVDEYALRARIRFGLKLESASWSSARSRWVLQVRDQRTGARRRFSCRFLHLCTGYYRYAQGYTPRFAGQEDFQGTIIHPQHWPEGFEHRDRTVAVIGSGATAVTLVPELARTARHVTMVQRSPSYVLSLPMKDWMGNLLRRLLPARMAYRLIRWRNIFLGIASYWFLRRYPGAGRRYIERAAAKALGDGVPVQPHFSPRYDPWDQRLCLVPDEDLFHALKSGAASVVTDEIERFTPRGLRLRSGREVEAEVVVTATGLSLELLGGASLAVDDVPLKAPELFVYRGCMLGGVPNLAFTVGYTNASWTLKAELVSRYVVRLLGELERTGHQVVVPVVSDPDLRREPVLDFSAGYVQRSLAELPSQGHVPPWKLRQNYLVDSVVLGAGNLHDGVLQFRSPAP